MFKNFIDKFIVVVLSKKISNYENRFFSITFPDFWRKSFTLKKGYLFFEENKNYGLIIKYQSSKLTRDEIVKRYEKIYSDCKIHPNKYLINNRKALKWIFDYEKFNTLEIKRIIIGNKVTIDISYFIKKDLEETKFINELNDFEKIINTIKFS